MFENENEIVNEEEIETTDEPSEDPAPEEDAADEELVTDLELDENGDVILPDDEDEVPVDEEEDEVSEDDQGGEEEEPSEEDPEEEPEPAAEPEETKLEEDDPREKELAKLRRELAAIKSQSRDTLKKLGVNGDDVMAGLVKLAAEASDQTPEEYLKKKQAEDRTVEAIRLLQTTEFNKKAAADLLAVQAAYPETKKYASIRDIPNFEEFGRMRDLGLSPKQAYAAANPDGTRQAAADATKRQSLENTKNHLKPTVSKSAKDTSVRMPRATLLEWRELFPGYSDKEIAELYKESIK